ncbi:MAG: MFS transporter [Spirochaetes bacterium]|nr:MFS transporter [Spirochaetota bacterium]
MEDFKGIRRFLYNFSTTGWNMIDSILMTFYVAFLLPPKEQIAEGMIQFIPNKRYLGIITVLGAIMIFGRIVDAVTDPIVASLSDRSKSPLGRRRTFLLIGALPLAVSVILIFFLPVPSTSIANGFYLALIFGLYFFFFTIYVGPYLSLIPELGHTNKARIDMTTAQAYFSLIGAGMVMIGGPLLLGHFMKTDSPVISYRKMAVIFALTGAVIAYFAVIVVDEKRFSDAKPSKTPLLESFKKTISSRPFVIYLISNIALWFLFNIVRSSAIHIGMTLLGGDEAFAGSMFSILIVSAAICFPIVGMIARKYGKKLTMILGLFSFAFFSVAVSLSGLTFVNARVWGLTSIALMGFPVAVLMVIPNVLLSDLCDLDYRITGERREAMYFGVQGFFMKLNLGISTATLAFLYSAFGKDVSNPLGVRLAPIAGSVIAIIGIAAMLKYPEKEIAAKLKD